MHRTLIRPTAFVDSPFGFDGKVARLAGGLGWFSAVELIAVDGHRRTGSELVTVEQLDGRLDEALAAQWKALTAERAPLQLGERTIRLDQPRIMGILNITPDSFSDGGKFEDATAAAEAGADMAAAGAAIVDVGGESTRPGASPVWEGDEIERIVPVIRQLSAGGVAGGAVSGAGAVSVGAGVAGSFSCLPQPAKAASTSTDHPNLRIAIIEVVSRA
jgi:dihydropteroate synthase